MEWQNPLVGCDGGTQPASARAIARRPRTMDDKQAPAGDDSISALTADFLQTARALFSAGNVQDT